MRAETVGDDAPVEPREDLLDPGVVDARDDRAEDRGLSGEGDEGVADVVEAPVAVEVVRLDVRDHRQGRREGQERTVVLVGLGHEELAAAEPGAGSPEVEAAADDDGRVEPRLGQEKPGHRGGRRLAVGPGDGDPLAHPHQLAEELGPLDDRDLEAPRLGELGGVFRDGGRRDEEVVPVGVGRVVADRDPGAEAGEAAGRIALGAVAARDMVAEGEEDLGEARHAGAADADEVHAVGGAGDHARPPSAAMTSAGLIPTAPSPAASITRSATASAASGRASPAAAWPARTIFGGSKAKGAKLLRQPVARRLPLRDDDGGPRLGERHGVGVLVGAGGGCEGDEDRRAPGGRQLEDGGGAGTAEDEVGPGVAGRQVVDERLDGRGDVGQREGAVALGDGVPLLRAGLVEHLDPEVAEERVAEGGRHPLVQDVRPLAAADDEQAQPPRLRARRGDAEEFRADRVAGDGDARIPQARGGAGEGDRHGARHRSEEAIRPARHGILLVEHGRDPARPGGGDDRRRRVAADAEDRARREPAEKAVRGDDAAGHLEGPGDARPGALADEPPRRDELHRPAVGRRQLRLEPPLGADEGDRRPRHPVAQPSGHGEAGEDVPPGSPSGHDEAHRAIGHDSTHSWC